MHPTWEQPGDSTFLHHSVNLSRTVSWMLRKRQLLSPWRSNLPPCECTETLLPIRTMVALLLSLPMDFTSLPTKFSLPYKNTFGHRAAYDSLRKSGAVKVIKDENDGKRGHRALIHRNWCHPWPMWRICITRSSVENDHATSKRFHLDDLKIKWRFARNREQIIATLSLVRGILRTFWLGMSIMADFIGILSTFNCSRRKVIIRHICRFTGLYSSFLLLGYTYSVFLLWR